VYLVAEREEGEDDEEAEGEGRATRRGGSRTCFSAGGG